MNPRAVVAGLVAVLLAGPVAPAAHTEPRVLSVSAAGPATAEFTVTVTTRFDYGHAVIAGTGRYAGLSIWNAARTRFHGGAVVLSDFESPARPATVAATTTHSALRPKVFGVPVVTLAPGRYRVYLLADRDADIRLPLLEGDGLTVRPTARSRQTVHTSTTPVGSAATSAQASVAVAFRPATMYHVVSRLWATAARDITLTACVTRRGGSCAAGQWVTENKPPDTLAGLTYNESGVGVHGRLVHRTMRAARAEATFADIERGTLGLALVAYDL